MSFDSGSTLQSCSRNRTYLHNLFKHTYSSSGLYVFTLGIKCVFSNLHDYFQTYTHVLNFPNCLYFFQNHRCLFKHMCIFFNLELCLFQTCMHPFKLTCIFSNSFLLQISAFVLRSYHAFI